MRTDTVEQCERGPDQELRLMAAPLLRIGVEKHLKEVQARRKDLHSSASKTRLKNVERVSSPSADEAPIINRGSQTEGLFCLVIEGRCFLPNEVDERNSPVEICVSKVHASSSDVAVTFCVFSHNSDRDDVGKPVSRQIRGHAL